MHEVLLASKSFLQNEHKAFVVVFINSLKINGLGLQIRQFYSSEERF